MKELGTGEEIPVESKSPRPPVPGGDAVPGKEGQGEGLVSHDCKNRDEQEAGGLLGCGQRWNLKPRLDPVSVATDQQRDSQENGQPDPADYKGVALEENQKHDQKGIEGHADCNGGTQLFDERASSVQQSHARQQAEAKQSDQGGNEGGQSYLLRFWVLGSGCWALQSELFEG